MNKNLWNWARLLYGLPLSITGLIYLFKPQGTVETLTSFIPGDLALIYVAGFWWFVFGLCITFDFKTRYACFGVLMLLSMYMIMIHIPAAYNGEYLNIVWFELLRNLSLMAGAIFLLSVEHNYQSQKC
jgi:uncharacterized membrane protein YphA (DoxX/SURF4 family)